MTTATSLQSFVNQPVTTRANVREAAGWPKLTVVTPSYNQAAFLERTILSVLNQQYPNLEYIIMDGGSTDGSLDIIKKYESYLSYWVSEPDQGQTDAINKGFRRATGDYVAYQNSDDVFAPGALGAVARAWQENPETDVFFGNMYIIDEQDRVLEEMRVPSFSAGCQVYEGMQVFNQSLFIRRTLLAETGWLDESLRFVMDYEVVTRLGLMPNVKFRRIADFWGGFRVQPDAKSSQIAATVGRTEHQQVSERYRPRLDSPLGSAFWRRYSRIRKFVWFLARGQFRYMYHRLSLR
ncbi:glycosyltransferase [Fibrella sp. HMF5335]|uniref:Glycosyltransferase n=1 Tax=Fibrella rubiginis TaxID=2817060 RepID=A0A939GI70_9BACT|nr:glycosyltransferase family 2 protein [Fibrella rubiginis]MBO0936933.1 glycosyltransferase [Fibrella rubiginis]